METCILTVLLNFLGLLLDVVKYVRACNLNPETDDIPHILLLNILLHDLVVRAYVLDCIGRDLALILLVATLSQSLTFKVV